LDAPLADQAQDDLVLAISQAVHGLGLGWIARVPAGQLDPARGEERLDALVPGLAVDVLVVVLDGVEGDELLTGSRRALLQVGVEHLLPRGRVNLGRLGEHPVEVEQAGTNTVRKPEHRREPTALVTAGGAVRPGRPRFRDARASPG